MNNQTDRIQNAINHIKTATDIDPWAVEIAVEAMDMAIEALKYSEIPNSSDTISRADAIDAIEKAKTAKAPDGEMYVAKINAEMNIQLLPSVQPEIVRCNDCKHHWIHRCMDNMPTEICDLNQTFYDPNIDFCSLAERRTDG